MAKRRWTLLLVPPGAEGSRAYRIPSTVLKTAVGAALVFAVVAGSFSWITLSRAINLTRLDQLERTNLLLEQEIGAAQAMVERLTDTLHAIVERDRQVRLLAGLEPTSADVQQAGIGGPVGFWSQRDELLDGGEAGRTALTVRAELGGLLRRANLLAGSFNEAVDSLNAHADRLSRTPSIMPTQGFLSSRFARERIHPIHHEARPHEGIDIAAPMGTPIVAPAGGVVVAVNTMPGYGKTVTIDHGYGLVTRYAHCSRILVRVGQRVRRNQEIALVGNSGISTAPHLHYEVIVGGRQQDPLRYIFPDVIVD